MLASILPGPVVAVLTVAIKFVALIFWFVLMLPGVLLHILPGRALRDITSRYCVWIARRWVATNRVIYHLVHPMRWRITVEGTLDPRRNYLLISNHQSWADILVLFVAFHGRVPFLRFFLKDQLKYIPIIGQVCWAMEFPFMKRYSREQIAANPALRNQDLETTRAKCEVYKRQPVTVVNFLEGTRFTPEKHERQQSPFRYLLKPKSAGAAFTLRAMGEQFAGIVDVTLVYAPTLRAKTLLGSWLMGEQGDLQIHVRVEPVSRALLEGDYEDDADFRAGFQQWVSSHWSNKDERIGRLRGDSASNK